jgi:serine/threonine-protein kinase
MTTQRLLSNRYELGETLGYGGMSEVHRGRDVRLGRDVAVKVLRADLARDPTFQERFRREAQNAAALNHPAIVAVYDTGETQTEYGPLPYIVMEYVDGRTLRDIVKTEGPLPGKRAMEVMADVCAALDFSHRHGIVHRDVKPANVMITKAGAVKVMDFGIARAVADNGQAAVTQTAAVIGTAQYLSPEQARGEAVDARSDVYAAGCVLFELLTGEPPFTGDSPVAVAYQHVREDPKPPSALNPRVSPALDAIVLKAMAKNPANRYQSSAEMRGDLVRVLSGQRPAAPAVMTEDVRTSVMNAGRPTEMMGGRHRPTPPDDYYDDEAYAAEDEDRRRRRKRAWTITLIVLLVAAALILVAWLVSRMSGNTASGNVTVPNVVGQIESTAFSTLSQGPYNLKPTISNVPCPATAGGTPTSTAAGSPYQCTDPSSAGKVLGTNPTSGTSVAPGSSITLYVGVAPGNTTVPSLLNFSQADATAAIQKANLALGQVTNQTTMDPTKVGKVISQSINSGLSVQAGTQISITMGTAPPMVTMPDVTGQQQSTATATLQGQQYQFQVSAQQIDSSQPSGTVVKTNPSAGNQVSQGGAVTIYVSNGSQVPFTMPTIIGMKQSQAQSALQAQGWTGHFQVNYVQTFDMTQQGLINDQSPGPNQPVTKNQTVSIRVYQFSTGLGGGSTTTTPPTTTTTGIFGG